MRKLIGRGVALAAMLLAIWLGHSQLRKTSPGYNFFFTPEDLYSNLASSPFDLTKAGYSAKLHFSSKYPGNHWVALIVDKPAQHFPNYGSDFSVKVTIRKNGTVIAESIAKTSNLWFHGRHGKSGFALATFKVPEHWAVDDDLVASAKVLKASPFFQEKYGEQTLVVGKYSDE